MGMRVLLKFDGLRFTKPEDLRIGQKHTGMKLSSYYRCQKSSGFKGE